MSAVLMENSGASYAQDHQPHEDNDFYNDNLDSTIKLKLKKPDFWKWELSTSASNPNINFPHILLYDNENKLLAETCAPNIVINNDNYENYVYPYHSSSPSLAATTLSQKSSLKSNTSSNDRKKNLRKSSSTLTNSSSSPASASQPFPKSNKLKRRSSVIDLSEINENLNNVCDYLRTEGINYKLTHHPSLQNLLHSNNFDKGSANKLYQDTSLKYCEPDQNNYYDDDDDDGNSIYSSFNRHTLNTNEANNNNNSNLKIKTNFVQQNQNNNNNNNNNSRRKVLRRSLSNDDVEKKLSLSNRNINFERDTQSNKISEVDEENYFDEDEIWIWSGKGLIKRDFNSKEFDHIRNKSNINSETNDSETNFESMMEIVPNDREENTPPIFPVVKEVRFADLKKSKSTTELLSNSLSENKKCHRQNSTPSSKYTKQILEHMSAFKNSLPESQNINISTVQHGPKYFLRTSKAGTLVVCEENSQNRKVRKRPKTITKFFENNIDVFGATNCSNDNNNCYYDEAINKINKLITNASLTDESIGNQSNCLLKVSEVLNEKNRGKSVDNVLKIQNLNSMVKKQKNIRKCISAGNLYLSSSEDESNQPPKRQVNLRRKRKSPTRLKKDQIFVLNNNCNNNINNNLTPLKRQLPITSNANVINNSNRNQVLCDFMKSFDENEYNNTSANNVNKDLLNPQTDSILRDNDDSVVFEILRKSDLNNKLQDIVENDNNWKIISENSLNSKFDENNKNKNDNNIEINNFYKNMGSNVSRNSASKQQERGRSHSSGDIHSIKHHSNFYHLSSNNPSDKLNTIPNSDSNPTYYYYEKNSELQQQQQVHQHQQQYQNQSTNKLIFNNKQKILAKYTKKENITTCILTPADNCSSNNDSSDTAITPDINHYFSGTTATNNLPLDNQSKLNNEKYCVDMTVVDYEEIKKKDKIFRGSLPSNLDSDTFVNIDDDDEKREKKYYFPANPLTTNITNSIANCNQQSTSEYVTVTQNRHQPNQNKQSSSLFNASEKEFSSNCLSARNGSINSGSVNTFKINQAKPDIQLILPTRGNFDTGCDQGYGSERSPEDELPPSMPNLNITDCEENQFTTEWNCGYNVNNEYGYDFITEDCIFNVNLVKGPRGLGLSISGGIDTNSTFPGLIRIKRIFPHQSAFLTGQFQPGDIILEANSIPLTGLTNYEALEVLRNMPNDVHLLICRPIDEQYKKLSPPSEPPKPPQRTQQQSTQTQTIFENINNDLYDPVLEQNQLLALPQSSQPNYHGQFEIVMVKQQGSLGFTLRKEDESVLGHYVRALVKEPALSDSRIKIGDKIVAVNDVDLSQMTHEQAVIFLRQSGDVVKLCLYRDGVQTPVEATTPQENNLNSSFSSCGKKVFLRPEAINLLTDLAHKKQNSIGDSTESSNISTSSSPRRLKRGHKSESSQSEHDTNGSKSSSNPVYLVSSQTSTICSDSDQSIDSKCSYTIQKHDPSQKTCRPNFLDLSGNSSNESNNSTPKKQIYKFVANNVVYDLNNLDNDTLDAPYNLDSGNNGQNCYRLDNKLPPETNDFISLPCEVLLSSDLGENVSSECINNKNPLYQSVLTKKYRNDDTIPEEDSPGNESLFKWKGVVLAVENDKKIIPEADTSINSTIITNTTTTANNTISSLKIAQEKIEEENKQNENLVQVEKENDEQLIESLKNTEGYKILSVELNRGWNSRLGFSLQPIPNHKIGSVISAIYSDSVAARDGRLRTGDILISVNDDSVENLTSTEVIDLLRIIRGLIVITVLRKDL